MDLSKAGTQGKDAALDARIAYLCGMQKKGGGRNAVMAARQQIPKKKFVEGECYIQIMPAILAVPFNPADLSDASYNMERRFLFKGMSAYAGVKLLKDIMRSDPALASGIATIMGVGVEMFQLEDPEVSEKVQTLFMRYRTVDVVSYPVQRMKFNDPAFKWGRRFRVDVELDGQGDVIPEEGKELPLSVRMFQMETALIAAQNKLRNQAYENGELKDRTEKEIEAANKAAWKNRLIGSPFSYGVVRSVIIACDRDFTPSDETVTAMKNAANYFTFEQYTGINGKFLKEEIEDKAGSRRDRYFDFFAVRVECKYKQKPDETLLETVARTTRALCSIEEDFTQQLTDFVPKFRAYRDEPTFWKPEIMTKSVRDFHSIDDNVLLQRMKDDISHYNDVLRTKEIAEQFASLITAIDSQLGTELLMLNETGDARAVGLTAADLEEAPKDSVPDTTITEALDNGDMGMPDLEQLGRLLQESEV